MTVTDPDDAHLAARTDSLARMLATAGLDDPVWRQALGEVPRHLFVPPTGWVVPSAGRPYPIDWDADEDTWWQAVYSDSEIVTQADDGKTAAADGTGLASSSISRPSQAFRLLNLLDIQEDHRVLDVGTGTGWSAALLTWRLGWAYVTTIEVDGHIAATAGYNLNRAGYEPRQITGDGAAGWPDGAPYDRVHVTCGVQRIPPAWIEQIRPGGRIVLPWAPGTPTGHLLCLHVLGDGTACGRLYGRADVMMLRSQRPPQAWNPHHADAATPSLTRVDPRAISHAGASGELFIALQVPGTTWVSLRDQDGYLVLLAFESGDPDGAWAQCNYRPRCADFPVMQYGRRCLWDEISAAYLRWLSLGCPAVNRYGLTVTPEGQHLWLDSPSQPLMAAGEPGGGHA
jgi:protein-L-isoaspartate O-methyltransferase